MIVRPALSPDFAKVGLRAVRNSIKGRRLNRPLQPVAARYAVADVLFSPFSAHVLPVDLDVAPTRPTLALELVRHVLVKIGGRRSCVSLYRGGPEHVRHVIHLRFHNPPQDYLGVVLFAQLAIEVALLRLRVGDVEPLLAELRAAGPQPPPPGGP